MQIVLSAPTQTLLAEIADKRMKRKDVAATYRLAMQAESAGAAVDWSRVNEAIRNRWSHSGLVWIKTQAWKEPTMKPDHELREFIAARLMGWVRSERFSDVWTQNGSSYMRLPEYELEIAPAFQAVEAARLRHVLVEIVAVGTGYLIGMQAYKNRTALFGVGTRRVKTPAEAPYAVCELIREGLAALESEEA